MSIDPVYMHIGERITAARKRQHITPSTLTQRTHLPIGRIEMGLEVVTIPALLSIAKALHCKVAHLLPENEEKK